ncbi:sensor histidine kinase [Lutibaculum baratangense]|uniref:Blue-light-activated histidine kinase n=1 Tax=Lutibaculum baratangense AMV1 TaxID=631454 RepID=V4RJ57_9HYPH|nr:HWE histidine kinase domain-containing protein [Lutibaculum baratangense]ESR25349.1 putative chemotaxis methyltransferase protein [Lutibaculum baratangense AMV1]
MSAEMIRRLQAAIEVSNISVSSQDNDLRYAWIVNPPQNLSADRFIGRTDEEVFPSPFGARMATIKRQVLERGEGLWTEVPFTAGDDGPRWYDVKIDPWRDQSGGVIGVNCVSVDITDRRQTTEHLRVLLRELAHRSKNLMAVIQSIASQTARGVPSVEQFVSRFSGRLQSLARAHDIITDEEWRGATLHQLARAQVTLYADWPSSRVNVSGPHIFLSPNAAQHLGLALHELATNAIRHGALSGTGGHVEISWDRTPDANGRRVVFEWRERGGPPVSAPRATSFGRLMLEQIVPAAVGGKAELRFEPYGVSYRLEAPERTLLQ